MFKPFVKRTLLSLMIISLVLGLIFLIEHFTVGTKQDLDTVFGFVVIAVFFGIPYFIFFRSSTPESKNNPKRPFFARKCQSCNSSQFKPYKEGYKCEHCGAVYH